MHELSRLIECGSSMYICMEDESKIYEPVAQVQSNVTIRRSSSKLNAELFNDEDVDCIIDCKVAERILVTSQQPRISEETQLQRDYDNVLF